MVGAGTGRTEIDWNEVDGERQGVDSGDEVRHIERNYQLDVTRTILGKRKRRRPQRDRLDPPMPCVIFATHAS